MTDLPDLLDQPIVTPLSTPAHGLAAQDRSLPQAGAALATPKHALQQMPPDRELARGGRERRT